MDNKYDNKGSSTETRNALRYRSIFDNEDVLGICFYISDSKKKTCLSDVKPIVFLYSNCWPPEANAG